MPGFERLMWPYDVALFAALVLTGVLTRAENPIAVHRKVDERLSVRQVNDVQVLVSNLLNRRIQMRILDEEPRGILAKGNEVLMTLQPYEERSFTYELIPTIRGDFQSPGTIILVRAKGGLAWVKQHLPNSYSVAVYPNLKALKTFDFLNQKGRLREAGLRRTRFKGLGTEFESLRDYNDDDIRLIDWKSSARRGKLIVKNFEQERNQSVMIVLDCGRQLLGEVEGVTKLDHALDSVLMILHAAHSAGDLTGIYGFHDQVTAFVAPKKGRSHFSAVMKASYALEATPVEPNYAKAFSYMTNKWKRRSLLIVFTDSDNEDQARSLVSALAILRRQHLVLVVRVKDPHIDELMTQPIVNSDDLSMRASAVWYNSDRQKAGSILRNAGFHTVEAEPQHLAAELVNTYFDIKDRALL